MGRQGLAVCPPHGLPLNAAAAWGLQQLAPAWRLGSAITRGTPLAGLLNPGIREQAWHGAHPDGLARWIGD